MAIRQELAEFAGLLMEADLAEIELVQACLNTRRKFLFEMQTHENQGLIVVGDFVDLCNLSTKYLNGANAKVLDIRPKGFYVEVYSTMGVKGDAAKSKASGWKGVIPFGCVKRES